MKAMVKIGKNGEAKTYEIRNENEYLTMLTEIGEINHIRGNASAQMFNYAWFRNITKINPTIQFQIAGDPRPAYVTVVDEKKPTKLLNLADLEKRLPRVEHNGTTYWLAEDAYYDNYQDTIAYYAHAYDWLGNEYLMRWDITAEYAAELEAMRQAGLYDDVDQSVACDWDSPAEVTLLVENAVEIIPLPYLLTARGQELFGGETGMEIDLEGLEAVLDANPTWERGEFTVRNGEIRYNGETVAKSDEE